MTRRVQKACDVWFAAFPVWTTPLFAYAWIRSEQENPVPLDEGGAFALIVLSGATLMMGTAFACCWVLNRSTRGIENFLWLLIVLLPLPVGSSICYFFKLRRNATNASRVE